MRIEQSYFQKAKALFHGAQALFTFIAACLALALFTKAGNHGGQLGFYFALCFLSLPALIYQVMVPAWTRAWRFANIYAYLALDLLFTLLWFAATIALGVWESQGIKKGIKDHADDDNAADESECETWAWGSVSKCKVTKAAVGLGVVIFLLWCLTSAVSVWMFNKYRKTGVVPGSKGGGRGAFQPQVDDPASKDAWSTRIDEPDDNMYDHHSAADDDAEDRRADDERRNYGQVPDYDEHDHHTNNTQHSTNNALLPTLSHQSSSLSGGFDAHPGRRSPMNAEALSISPAGYDEGMAPSALSPTGVLSPTGYGNGGGRINPFVNPSSGAMYESQPAAAAAAAAGGRVNFPAGNY